jgi:protein SCO1/2
MSKKEFIASIILALSCSSLAATDASLTDVQLSQIRYEQKPRAQVRSDLTFLDETGRPVHLGDYFGQKPTVLMLGYYGCPMLCTLVLNGAADCFRDLTWKGGREYNVVFASIDSSETPALAAEKKKSYLHSYGVDCAGGWHLLTGGQNSISNLAAEVGFHYAYDPGAKQFAHPSGLVILTPGGKVARYFFGVNFAAKDVDEALRAAAANEVGPPESPFTLLCFHYSPIHGRYGKLILTMVRVGGLLVLGILACLVFAPAGKSAAEDSK